MPRLIQQGRHPIFHWDIGICHTIRGGLLIHSLYQRGTDSIHEMSVMNTDALSHHNKSLEKCLLIVENGKKRKYLEACLRKHYHFSPFVVSVDRLLGVEAEDTLKRISIRLATKWKQPYSRTCGYIKSRVDITFFRVTHHCIRGSQVTARQISLQRPKWEDSSGLYLLF